METAMRRAMGHISFLKDLLSEFGREKNRAIDTIRKALDAGDAEELAAPVHTLKGEAGNS